MDRTNHTLNWAAFQPPASWRQNSSGRYDGPCQITGEGRTKAWAVPDSNVIGCSIHGDGSGKLTGSAFREHAAALGLIDVDLGPARRKREPLDTWTWQTAAGKRRRQFRWLCECGRKPDCKTCHGRGSVKTWAKTNPRNVPPPRDLMYVPGGELPAGAGTIYMCEGASDTDAVQAFGLSTIGRTNAVPSAESLKRLDKAAKYRIWPDHDRDLAGYRQAVSWSDVATAAGLRVEAIDPLELHDDKPPAGWDARDWIAGLPTGTTPDAAGAMLAAAVVDVQTLRDRCTPAAVQAAGGRSLIDAPRSQAGFNAMLAGISIGHRYNVRSHKPEFMDLADGDVTWQVRSDERVAEWLKWRIPTNCLESVEKEGTWETVPLHYRKSELLDLLAAHCATTETDPFRTWLEAMHTEWDGSERHWLGDCFPSAAADPLARWASRSITLAAVRRAFEPGAKVDEVLVLQGAVQGTSKTTALSLLATGTDGAHKSWFRGIDLSGDYKRAVEAIQGPVIVEAGELAGVSRSDIERLKHFLTTDDDGSIRLAYRRDPIPLPRRIVIIGTTNEVECLPPDPTGNRRFVVVPVSEREENAARVRTVLTPAYVAQVWLEALHRYQQGEPHWIPAELRELHRARCVAHRRRDATEDWVHAALLDPSKLPNVARAEDGWPVEVTMPDVISAVTKQIGPGRKPSDGAVSAALKMMTYKPGWGRKNGANLRVWRRSYHTLPRPPYNAPFSTPQMPCFDVANMAFVAREQARTENGVVGRGTAPPDGDDQAPPNPPSGDHDEPRGCAAGCIFPPAHDGPCLIGEDPATWPAPTAEEARLLERLQRMPALAPTAKTPMINRLNIMRMVAGLDTLPLDTYGSWGFQDLDTFGAEAKRDAAAHLAKMEERQS